MIVYNYSYKLLFSVSTLLGTLLFQVTDVFCWCFAVVVGLSDAGNMSLSLKNESFSCTAEQEISFNTQKVDNYTFGVSQVLRNLKVQAFGLKNNSYSTGQ